jgi:carbonic anhydrase
MVPRLRRRHQAELERLPDEDARAVRLAELNVQQSIEVLKQHPAIKKASTERGLTLHALLFDLGVGELRVLDDASGKPATGLWSPN